MKFIFLGDVVGEPGRDTVRAAIPALKERFKPDFFVVNGENAAGGNGITPRLAVDLMRAGADVITLGDHAWDQREIVPYFSTEPRLLRPLNFPPGTPGFGSVSFTALSVRVTRMGGASCARNGPSSGAPASADSRKVSIVSHVPMEWARM